MDLETTFAADLQRWLAAIYERMEAISDYEDHLAVERVLERENRLLIALVVILGLSILLLPMAGGAFMLAALALLYVGALGSSVLTILKIRRLEQTSARREAIRRRHAAAWKERPPLGPNERAQLVRIMNLCRLQVSDSVRGALASELSDARALPALASWPPIEDVMILMRERPVIEGAE